MRSIFYKNIGYSFAAQFSQLCLSCIITLLLPLLLGVEEFGYWQLFIFYTQYGAFFHFGLIDGIYLREGGKRYIDLDYAAIGYQQRLLFIVDFFFLLLYIWIASSIENLNRSFIIILSGVLMLVGNLTNFYSMLLSSVNEFKVTSIGRLCFSLSFMSFVLLSFFYYRFSCFKPYVIAYIVSYSFYMIFCLYKSKEIFYYVFNKGVKDYRIEALENFKRGFVLLIANITGMLLLGITRFFIDSRWGIEVFGKVSYSLVVVNFVLMFISEISAVMYPELRMRGERTVDGHFLKIQKILMILTPVVLFLYYPVSYIIEHFLPDYIQSVKYMVFLLPVCVYEAKVMLQVNTYFKVLNKPKELLFSNLEALLFGTLFSLLAVFYFDNVILAIITMPLTICFQYVISLKKLRPSTYLTDLRDIIPEAILIVYFIIINTFIPTIITNILLFFVAVTIYGYFCKSAKTYFFYLFIK